MALKVYEFLDPNDPANNVEFNGTWQLVHNTDLSDNPQERVLFWADVEGDPGDNGIYKWQAKSNPGTDPIVIQITDSNPGSGHEADEITIAETDAGLDTAIAGASLNIGTEILSGYSNRQEIHIRVENAVTQVVNSTELKLAYNQLLKSSTV